MSLASLFHTETVRTTGTPSRFLDWLRNTDLSASLNRRSLSSVVIITGYLLVISSLTLSAISGEFPWFVLMLVVFMPLFALMTDQGQQGS